MNNHSTQNIHHADAPASVDAPGCASPPFINAVQAVVLAALNETEENPLLRVNAAGDSSPIYGGLTHGEVVKLVRSCQAGNMGLCAWTLAVAWWKNPSPSPTLLKATAVCFRDVFNNNQPRFMHEFARATALLLGHPPGSVNRDLVGHANWWRVQILMYMLQNPKPVYQIREFVRLLKADNLNTDTKDIRAFCKHNNIARDSRPGRPTKKEEMI